MGFNRRFMVNQAMAMLLLNCSLPPMPDPKRREEPKDPLEPNSLLTMAGMNREEDAPQLRLPSDMSQAPSGPPSVVIRTPESAAKARRTERPVFSTAQPAPILKVHTVTHSSTSHQHSTVGPAKVCQDCGQRLSGAELREIRERQAKVAGRYANQNLSPWDRAKHPTRQEERMAYEKTMRRAGARGV